MEGAFTIYKVSDSAKLNYLLHFIGAETYDTLCDLVSPNIPEQNTYTEVCKLLSDHFDPINFITDFSKRVNL